MLLKLIRFFRGYVEFYILGKFPERFINLMLKNNIRIWNTKRKDKFIYSCMYMSDYIKIRKHAEKCKCKTKIVNRYGMPKFIRKHRARLGIIIGIAIFTLISYIMSCFVWSIDIVGIDRVSYSRVKSLLADNGFYVGAFKPKMNYSEITRKLMLSESEIGWMAINVSGTYASVEIKEKANPPKVNDTTSPCNVKAKCDGEIVSINTFKGEAYIIAGSGVVKDQLLVSGVINDQLGGISLVHANAEIMAKTSHDCTFELPKYYTQVNYKDQTKHRKRINILNLEFPLTISGVDSPYYAINQREDCISLFDTPLPVSIVDESVNALDKSSVELDKKTAESIFKTKTYLYELFALNNCKVSDRDFEIKESSDEYECAVSYSTIEDISYTQKIIADDFKIERKVEHAKNE